MGSVHVVKGRLGARIAVALVAVSVSVLGFSAVSVAATHRAPRVTSFQIASNLSSTGHVHFSYATKNVTRQDKIVFQRKATFGGWVTVKTLKNHSGRAVLAPFDIGRYDVRVAILKKNRLQSARVKTVFVYGDIPLKNICNASNVDWGNRDRGCNSTTALMGQFLFSSVVTFDAPGTANNTAPQVNLTISTGDSTTDVTSCRMMHLDYGESNSDEQHAGGETMIVQTVSQADTPPVTTTFPGGAEQHTDIKLDGGPVEISDQWSATNEGTLEVLENGTLNCYTTNGVVPGS
jgi:hypothetical protein